MTYGIVSTETREYIERRAAEGNVSEHVKLEYKGTGGFVLSVTVDGARDEEFRIGPTYEINIADWVAELLSETCDSSLWEVEVYTDCDCEDSCDCERELVYRTDGYSDHNPYSDDPRDN